MLLLLTAIASGEALAAPYISIAATPASVEEGETIKFTISRTGSTSSALEQIVIYFAQYDSPFVCDGSRCPVTYFRPRDFGYECAIFPGVQNHRCFTIPAGESSITVDVPTYPTTLHEEDARLGFIIRGGLPEYTGMNHYRYRQVSRIYVTVRDGPDVTPDVKATLSIPDNRATEGDASDPATVALTLTGANSSARISPRVPSSRGLIQGESLKVPLQFSGGTPGTDFTLSLSGNPRGVTFDASTSTVTFTGPNSGASASTATLVLTAANDPDADDATVTVDIPYWDNWFSPKLTASGIPGSASGTRNGDGRILLIDPDTPPPPQISISGGADVTEGSAAIFTLSADPAPSDDISVEVEVSDSGDFATGGQAGSRTVTIGASGSASLGVATANDGRDEPDGTITATIGSGDGYTVDSRSHTASVAVADDDVPVVAFASASSGAGEAAGTRNVTLDLDPAPGAGITLNYGIGGTATEGSGNDFTIESSGTVSVAPGAATATIPIAIVDDASNESAETVVLTLTDGTGYTLGATKAHTLTIADNDAAVVPPGVTVSTDALSLAEGGAAGSYTVVLASKPTADVTVTATSGDAGKVKVHGPGGTAGASATLTFTPTTWNRAQTVTVTPQDDADADDESVALTHAVGNTGGYGGVTATSVTVTVDDDETPTLSVAVAPASANEGAAGAKGYASVTFGLDPTRAQATGFKACLKNTGTATRGSTADYLLVGPSSDTPLSLSNDCHSYTLPGNAASGQVRLLIRGDGEVEPDETVVVELRDPPQGVTVSGAAGLATYTIVNDDTAPNACYADVKPDVQGYAGETHYGNAHVTRWKKVLAAFGDANGHTTMTAAEAQTYADRGWSRWDPVVTALQCLEAAPAQPETPAAVPEITVSGGNGIAEGGTASFTVTATPAPSSPLAVTLTVCQSGDYAASGETGTRQVTVPTGGSVAIEVATADDATDEPDGSVSATVEAGTDYMVGGAGTASVSVADDDDPVPDPVTPELRLSAGSPVDEGGNAVFTVHADQASDADLTVELTVAQTGDVLSAPGAGSRQLTLAAGATSATLTLATADDGADEPDGSVSVTLDAGTGYTVADPPDDAASVAVRDNDEPVVSIAAGTKMTGGVTEGAPAAFTLTATPAPHAALTVSLAVSQSGDFAASGQTGTRQVTIPTGGSIAFEVATVNDTADEPDGSVTATLAAGSGYAVAASPDDAASVAVADDDVAAAGVPSLSVNDVEVKEGPYRPVEFTVTLSEPASRKGAWFYWRVRESSPVSAKRNVDFWASAGKKFASIRPGQTEYRIIAGMVVDDSHDEDPETFEIVLSDAHGAAIADGVGVATIVNDDPMPAAFLSRFGRTVAEQALDGIAGRIAAPRTAGAQGTLAGQALSFGTVSAADGAANDNAPMGGVAHGVSLAQSDVVRAFGASAGGLGGHGPDRAHGMGESHTMTGLEALLGSSFTATGEQDATGGSLAFWGRAAQSNFDGREGTFSLDGETTTAMLGADYARGKWLVGLALMQSSGEGGYADAGTGSVRCPQDLDAETRAVLCDGAVWEGDGDVEASLTAAVPYAAIQASDRLRLWGAAGHGTGEVTLKPDVGGSLKSNLSWTMAAAGARGDLLPPPREGSGPTLALTADGLWARTSSEKTHELAASDSDATRFRVGLEGGYAIATEGGGRIVPRVEIGARHDGGDAETGFGVEVGGGIAWTDPAIGLSLDLSGRTLIAHGSDDLEDRGFAASLAFDPNPSSERGLSLTLRQDWGGSAQGGLDALFATDPLADRTGIGEAESRWQAEAAYGLPAFSGRFTGSPHVGLGLATGARDYTLGWRLSPAANANAPDVSFGVKATRRESDMAAPEHTVGFEAVARW
ncbi:Calx-beta domain-containing protein [Methylobacterium sp.]|uniref:Calx-beta domain-containing protein n=1 Tax=Methylobacterium sp. TaxID=409 RepID=UPI003B5A6E97